MTTSLIHAQHLRPPMAALQDTLSLLHLLRLYGCIVPDNALLYLSAVVLRVHDAANKLAAIALPLRAQGENL